MEFRTKIILPPTDISLEPGSRVSFIGSCFANNIGERLKGSGFGVHVNPFGVLYNPQSISMMCRYMSGSFVPQDSDFFESQGMGHSWLNDSSFSAPTVAECRELFEAKGREERKWLEELDVLFVTLGTNRYYSLKSTGRCVGNCHKQPGGWFDERSMSIGEVTDSLDEAVRSLLAVRPSLKVVFTVSPYRYAKYGFHESQLGKSVLLLAVDELCRKYDNCEYFPAYEIVLDELRDYRFYADDMLHPSSRAVDYIWERFSESYFSSDTLMFIKEYTAIVRGLSHRPIHPGSEAHKAFLGKIMLKIEQLRKKYPNLVLHSLLKDFNIECED